MVSYSYALRQFATAAVLLLTAALTFLDIRMPPARAAGTSLKQEKCNQKDVEANEVVPKIVPSTPHEVHLRASRGRKPRSDCSLMLWPSSGKVLQRRRATVAWATFAQAGEV